ncbi:phospholipid scramblase 1 [Scheffersomyces stipitis CBS 6054]|uniref:Phospholipid scramblase n=1 Tax=Scheffersomyces stipitis (strain ATCC 58785 / CBS 6054 / NBRC 10063 / NRRL Y-11545) TaxID=322104 RepID=A3LVQ7_PICST|nr:phospholipid scramblase 1 [Scheffersomyces stipitis CBS 6054]ABN66823.2 phospholipid scramblase 1 [Scheffersomyces stipitis CBS 6054]
MSLLRTTLRGVHLRSPAAFSSSIFIRSFGTSSLLKFPRKTRITQEISAEEVKRYEEQQHQQGNNAKDFYYRTNPSSDAGEYRNEPSSFHTIFNIPPNENGLITPEDGIYDILKEPTLVIERQIEIANVILGFEQANRYKIMNSTGEQIGYMQEKDLGILKVIGRQFFRLHRPFDIDVFNNYGDLLLTIKRPFSFINSHIKCFLPGYDTDNSLIFEKIGESIQSWHLWRRRYNLFKLEDEVTDDFNQFGAIDAPFLSFDFPVKNQNGDVIASVDRNWVGLGRELFTDTGVYIVRMDPASFAGMGELYPTVAGPLTLDQRAILLGNAVSIDFDYFSRHSRGPGGGFLSFGGGE